MRIADQVRTDTGNLVNCADIGHVGIGKQGVWLTTAKLKNGVQLPRSENSRGSTAPRPAPAGPERQLINECRRKDVRNIESGNASRTIWIVGVLNRSTLHAELARRAGVD